MICSVNDLEEIDSREFPLDIQGTPSTGFLVRTPERIVAYKNQCPHAGVELNWHENKFLDFFQCNIQCTLHGALFNIDDGFCTWGPCQGQSLKPIDIIIEDGRIYRLDSDDEIKSQHR